MNTGAAKWLVRFHASKMRGEPAQLHQIEVPSAPSEREAIKAAFLRVFGGLNRPVHSLEMLGVSRLG